MRRPLASPMGSDSCSATRTRLTSGAPPASRARASAMAPWVSWICSSRAPSKAERGGWPTPLQPVSARGSSSSRGSSQPHHLRNGGPDWAELGRAGTMGNLLVIP